MQRDSKANTFVVAGGLCVVCSLLVSGAAVGLRGLQQANVERDKKRNILAAAGLIDPTKASNAVIKDTFANRIRDIVIDFETGEIVTDEYEDGPQAYDQAKAASSASKGQHTVLGKEIPDIALIKRRENRAHIYMVIDESGNTEGYVLPIRGYGLWSVLWGFLAIEADGNTIKGITYYQHGETPGLGGEVDNAKWKASWQGKQVFADIGSDELTEVSIKVVKGIATEPDLQYEVDGLSGATITSNGVTKMLQFWMGPDAFGPFLKQVQQGTVSFEDVSSSSTQGDTNG